MATGFLYWICSIGLVLFIGWVYELGVQKGWERRNGK